jgi:8-oxo-dGTP diphosphatase
MNNKYVCGFVFIEDFILLIKKNNPEWMAGLYNGIGGKIDGEESAIDAMEREFSEEVGFQYSKHSTAPMNEFMSLDIEGSNIKFFRGCLNRGVECFSDIKHAINNPPTKEDLGFFRESDLPQNIIQNLRWIIPVAIYEIRYSNISQ